MKLNKKNDFVKKWILIVILNIPLVLLSQSLPTINSRHPRLFLNSDTKNEIQKKINSSVKYKYIHDEIIRQCEQMQTMPVVQKEILGKRMLAISRTCLKRVSYNAYAFLMTGQQKYFEKARDEMLAASQFDSWNPSHFLDVGEMSLALAIGYDWLYDELSEKDRNTITAALWEKGMAQVLDPTQHHSWITRDNNWNQVCHAGMAAASVAIFESRPVAADSLIRSAVKHLPLAMHHYRHNGNYPEGGMYWGYGTTFNVLLICALETAFGTDFGLFSQPGFAKTPFYYLHIVTPTGRFFNYSDCNEYPVIMPAMYYFAGKQNRPGLLFNEMNLIEQYQTGQKRLYINRHSDRLLPFTMIWGITGEFEEGPETNNYIGEGPNPVAMWRRNWTDFSLFLGIKGGSPAVSHGHMDIGSFILEKYGVRWALDLGKQDYHSLEKLGMNIWDRSKDGDRWKVFRYNNFSHNTLVVNDSLQIPNKSATLEVIKNTRKLFYAKIDMSDLYELDKALRSFKISKKDVVTITDEIASPAKFKIRRAFITDAEILINEDRRQAVLKKSGKELTVSLLTPKNAKFQVFPSSTPPNNFDAENENTKMLGIEIYNTGETTISVEFR